MSRSAALHIPTSCNDFVIHTDMHTDTADSRTLHELRAASYDAVRRAHAPYVDETTGLFDATFTEQRRCPVCDGDAHRVLFRKSGGLYVKCRGCGMVFTNPVFTKAALHRYYVSLDVDHAGNLEREQAFFRRIYGGGLERIAPHAAGCRLLDIGCSSGFFLDMARAAGFETHGLELNSTDVALARARGHSVQECGIEATGTDEHYDVITMWDVFEHIPDPQPFLDCVMARLAPQGILFLQVPNSGALAPQVLHERCNMFDGLEHVCLYDPATIRHLVTSRGERLLDIGSVIPELYAVRNHLAYDDAYMPDIVAPAHALFQHLSEAQVLAALLGYKLQVVIGK